MFAVFFQRDRSALNRNPFEVRRRFRAQVVQQTLAVPVHEVHHAKLIGLGVRAWLVSRGVDAALVLFGQATVLVVGRIPDPVSYTHLTLPTIYSV